MKIEFVTFKRGRFDYDEEECHQILVDGKVRMSQWEGIEPEDTRFYRDLTSPHECESIIQEVIEAVKRGEEVEIVYDEREDD